MPAAMTDLIDQDNGGSGVDDFQVKLRLSSVPFKTLRGAIFDFQFFIVDGPPPYKIAGSPLVTYAKTKVLKIVAFVILCVPQTQANDLN
jgi:hypothetical protein